MMTGKVLLGFFLTYIARKTLASVKESLLDPTLKNRKEREAFERAIDWALAEFQKTYPALYLSFFDEHFAKNKAAPELSRILIGKDPDARSIALAYAEYFSESNLTETEKAVKDFIAFTVDGMKRERLHNWVAHYERGFIRNELLTHPTLAQVEEIVHKEGDRVIDSARKASTDEVSSEEREETLEKYRAWVKATTAGFIVPGISKSLDISSSWIDLKAVEISHQIPVTVAPEEAINRYHNSWKRESNRDKEYDAEWLAAALRQVVILGGPGSGKSLLLRRIAHRESVAGRNVIFVRLQFVARMVFTDGKPFEEALLSVATNGSGMNEISRRLLNEGIDIVLADGLDECGIFREPIAEEISKWAKGHLSVTVIVTTRSVGHNPAVFAEWPHFRILPLEGVGPLSRFVDQLLSNELLVEQPDRRSEVFDRIEKDFLTDSGPEENKEFAFVKSSPLLFTFMLSLAINGVQIPNTRKEFYDAVIDLLGRTEVPCIGSEETDKTVAFRSLDIFGWLLMHDQTCDFLRLMEDAGRHLEIELRVGSLKAQLMAEQMFKFWEKRRVLERLHIGMRQLGTFVHLGLCEFAAARYLSRLESHAVVEWLSKTSNDPRWKEVYLHAGQVGLAQTLIDSLLDVYGEVKAPSARRNSRCRHICFE